MPLVTDEHLRVNERQRLCDVSPSLFDFTVISTQCRVSSLNAVPGNYCILTDKGLVNISYIQIVSSYKYALLLGLRLTLV